MRYIANPNTRLMSTECLMKHFIVSAMARTFVSGRKPLHELKSVSFSSRSFNVVDLR